MHVSTLKTKIKFIYLYLTCDFFVKEETSSQVFFPPPSPSLLGWTRKTKEDGLSLSQIARKEEGRGQNTKEGRRKVKFSIWWDPIPMRRGGYGLVSERNSYC